MVEETILLGIDIKRRNKPVHFEPTLVDNMEQMMMSHWFFDGYDNIRRTQHDIFYAVMEDLYTQTFSLLIEYTSCKIVIHDAIRYIESNTNLTPKQLVSRRRMNSRDLEELNELKMYIRDNISDDKYHQTINGVLQRASFVYMFVTSYQPEHNKLITDNILEELAFLSSMKIRDIFEPRVNEETSNRYEDHLEKEFQKIKKLIDVTNKIDDPSEMALNEFYQIFNLAYNGDMDDILDEMFIT